MKTKPFQTKSSTLPGSNYAEVRKNALACYYPITHSTKRRPYIRSAYFNKQKIFFDYFWTHLRQKSPKTRLKRLKYFKPAIELIQNSRITPVIQQNVNKKTEYFYRFLGRTKDGNEFYVQIKENIKSEKKYFMSCFQKK